jgi:hypothetical protein
MAISFRYTPVMPSCNATACISAKNRNPAVKTLLLSCLPSSRRTCLGVAVAGAASLLGGCSVNTLAPNLGQMTQLTVPEPIRVPKGHQAVLEAQGKGTLLYECQAIKRAPFQYTWLLQSPGMTLQDSRGQTVQYLPGQRARWIHSDGSAVAAREFVEVTPDGTRLPLMRAKAEMSTGAGVLDNISYIQSLRTVAGVVTNPQCTAGNLGMRVSVPYEADFVFWRPAA